ncbi:MAG: hypothetical protein FJ164_13335 [Gammaproteobacteria bacterium]|nr:hypothetical protein [Gammaproteobacteria bacterium]
MSQSITALSPEELVAAWAAEPGLTYIDVRTVSEFCTGRPKGQVVNIPWEFHAPAGSTPHPNIGFVEVVSALFARDAPLITGCGKGPRALAAAEALCKGGFSNVRMLAGGFAAWQAQRLLCTTDNRPGVSYVSLLTRVRRPDAKIGPAGH